MAAGPQIGAYKCTYRGCMAAPFQTKDILDSHSDLHNSSRPHHCPVKRCARGEEGVGFKRLNEMIRHSMIHDSPGYVCPFCKDLEYKYPRPDNLKWWGYSLEPDNQKLIIWQRCRHVRIHHADKRKDPLLRNILRQRLDDPTRVESRGVSQA